MYSSPIEDRNQAHWGRQSHLPRAQYAGVPEAEFLLPDRFCRAVYHSSYSDRTPLLRRFFRLDTGYRAPT